jgi:hypothetical protein
MMHSPRPPKLPRLHQTNRSRRLRPLHPRLTKSPTSATSIQTIRHSTPASTPIIRFPSFPLSAPTSLPRQAQDLPACTADFVAARSRIALTPHDSRGPISC